MRYYVVCLRLDGKDRVLLWFDDDDGVDRVVVADGRVLTFASPEAARAHVGAAEDNPVAYDFDRVGAWAPGAPIDYAFLLNHWNLCLDVAASVPALAGDFLAHDRRASAAYDHLFWGCNLPAMTPPGRHHTPKWRRAELADLARVLAAGMALVRASLEATV
jgi:hypothetical protein